jgi:hypothetical protein
MLESLLTLPQRQLGTRTFRHITQDQYMSARQVVCRSREIYEYRCSVARRQARAAPLALTLQKRTPAFGEGVVIHQKTTNVLADKFIPRTSQDHHRGWISVQTIAIVVRDYDPIENISKNRRKFAIRIPKRFDSLSMLFSEVPQIADI